MLVSEPIQEGLEVRPQDPIQHAARRVAAHHGQDAVRGLLQANGWWLVLVPLFALALDRLAVRPEERHLAARFGEDYRVYSARVRWWL